MPTKTSYTDSESFDPTGMVVTASYNDNTIKSVINYTYPTTTLTTGTNSITVTYVESGSTFTAIVPILQAVQYVVLMYILCLEHIEIAIILLGSSMW